MLDPLVVHESLGSNLRHHLGKGFDIVPGQCLEETISRLLCVSGSDARTWCNVNSPLAAYTRH